MPIERVEAGQKTWQPPIGTQEDAFAEINLDESDPNKSITLLPPKEDEVIVKDQSDESPKEKEFLDRNKAVLKRISRTERRLEGQFSQRIADIQAENQRVVAKLNSDLEQLRTQRSEQGAPDERAHQAKMDQLQKDYVAALEAGDSLKSGQLLMEINRAQSAFETSKLAALLQKNQQQNTTQQPIHKPAAQSQELRGPTPTARKWIRANMEWFDDTDYRAETNEAKAIDQDLMAEGSDPDSQEHYAELHERLREKFPKLSVIDPFQRNETRTKRKDPEDEDDRDDRDHDEDEEIDAPRRMQARKPVVPNFQDRGKSLSRTNTNRRTITQSEAAEMRKFKMDPTKDSDVRAWDKSRRETENGYARSAR